ncbi:MAG: site-specific integrase [Deltaproteobacteria bacterium]|nr:site-specific integrase [Deltaproteobacteria bacterium]
MARARSHGTYAGPIRDLGRASPHRWARRVVAQDGQHEDIHGQLQAEVWDRSEARLLHLGARVAAPNLTVSAAAALFVAERRALDVWSDATVLRMRQDLAWLWCAKPSTTVRAWSKADTHAWLARLASMRFASQRTRWGSAVSFWQWCVTRDIVQASPLRLVDRFDKPWLSKRAKRQMGRGKPQLRNLEEAQAYLAAALAWPSPTDRVGALLPLLCGMRSGEVRHLQVADIDLLAGKIWIRDDGGDQAGEGWSVKTAASSRVVALPAELRDDLEQLCSGWKVGPDSFVLRSLRAAGGPYNVEWLRRLVVRTCRAADVRVISAHGLRGTYASILASHDQAAPDIGRYLGHADGGKTAARHYIGAEATKPALQVIPGGGLHRLPGVGASHEENTLWRSGRDLNPRPPA